MGAFIEGMSGGGGSKVLNGIIEEYRAYSETVDANNFVQFVQGKSTQSATGFSYSTSLTYASLSAVRISDDCVLLGYSENGKAVTVQAVRVDATNNTLTLGTKKSSGVTASSSYENPVKLIKLDANKAMFMTVSSTNILYAGIISIADDLTITLGTKLSISSVCTHGYSLCELSTDKAFCIYYDDTDSCLKCAVLSVSDTTITATVSTNTTGNSYSAAYNPNCIKFTASKVLVHYCKTSSYTSHYELVTISGDTPTFSGTSLSGFSKRSVNLINLSETKILVVTCGAMYAVIITVSGTTLTTGTSLSLGYTVSLDGFEEFSLKLISETEVDILLAWDSLSVLKLSISGTTLTLQSDTLIDGSKVYWRCAGLEYFETSIFYVYLLPTYKSYIYLKDTDTFVKAASTKIDGITKSKCGLSQKGKVWVLNA